MATKDAPEGCTEAKNMKIVVSKEDEKKVYLLNEAFFDDLKSSMFSVIGNIDEKQLEKLGVIVNEITKKHTCAGLQVIGAQKQPKRRSQAQKVGKFRYLNRKMDKLREDMNRVEKYCKTIMLSLSGFLDIEKDNLVKTACKDEIDEALLEYLRIHTEEGITPSEAIVSDELRVYRLKPYQVSRRIQRMNKRLKEVLNRDIANSINRRWKLSIYAQKKLEGEQEDDSLV